MKRSVKIGLTLMILGAVLFGVGWMNHGDKSVVWSRESRAFKTVQRVKRSYQPKDYRRIVIDSQAPVTIKAGDTSRVTVSYIDGNRQLPQAQVSHGALTIKGGHSTNKLDVTVFGLSEHTTTNGGVLVTVPRTKQLDSVVVKKGSGSVALRGLRAKQMTVANADDVSLVELEIQKDLTIQSSDGDIWASQIKANKLSVNTDDGDISVSDSHLAATDNQFITGDGGIRLSENHLGGGKIRSNDGDLTIQGNTLAKQLKATTADGDIRAYIGKSAGAKVTTEDADMSDITVQGKNRKNGYWLRRDAATQYQLSTSDGDIRVADSH